MTKFTFLHNLDLLENFIPYYRSINVAEMHDIIALHEMSILDLIQIPFDWTRSWDAKPRYNLSPEYQKESLYPNTWSLFNVDTNWNQENIKKGAEFLSKHLDYLPEYIIDAAFKIMGECLGYKVNDKNFVLPASDEEYQEALELGKCHLSVFMMVIEELGKLGIDCRAIKITTKPFFVGSKISDCFEGKNYFHDLKKIFRIQEYWLYGNKGVPNSRKKIVDRDFQYDTDKVYRQLTFNDLEEFLEMLLLSINRLCSFSSEMIDPSTLDFSKYYYPNAALPNSYHLPDGKMVDAKECIQNFLEKLRKGEFIAAYYRNKNDIDLKNTTSNPSLNNESHELSTNCGISVDPKLLKEFIDFLLAKNYLYINSNNRLAIREGLEEKALTIAHLFYTENQIYSRKNHPGYYDMTGIVLMYINIIKVNIANIFVDKSSSGTEKDALINELIERINQLEERQDNLEEKVDTLNDELADLKKQILNYIQTGSNKPDITRLNSSEAIEIIRNAPVSSVRAKIRKRLLLMAVALGLMGLLKSSNATLLSPVNDNLINSESPVISASQPIPSPDLEDVIITPTPTPEIASKSKVNIHILDEDNGTRDYYTSIYDKNKSGVTEKNGLIIRYFAFQNNNLVAELGREEDLQNFVMNNDVSNFTWKIAVSCLDFSMLQSYTQQGVEIPLQFTTFFADYVPTNNITRTREF